MKGMKDTLKAEIRVAGLKLLYRLIKRSECLRWKLGLAGIMSAEVTSGRHKGYPFGVAIAIDKARGLV